MQIRGRGVPQEFVFKYTGITKHVRLANDFLPELKVLVLSGNRVV